MLDSGRSLIYCLDLGNGDCFTIGEGKLVNAVDISVFGIFIVVLKTDSILLFSQVGAFLKLFKFNFSSTPIAVTHTFDTILVTGGNKEIYQFVIDLDN